MATEQKTANDLKQQIMERVRSCDRSVKRWRMRYGVSSTNA